MREQSKHSHLGDGWGTQRETKPQNTAKEQSIIGRKITSGLFYLTGRNINHTEGWSDHEQTSPDCPLSCSLVSCSLACSRIPRLLCNRAEVREPVMVRFSCSVLPSPVQSSPIHWGLAPALLSCPITFCPHWYLLLPLVTCEHPFVSASFSHCRPLEGPFVFVPVFSALG